MTAVARADINRRRVTKQTTDIAGLVRSFTARVADALRRFFRAVLDALLADPEDEDEDTPTLDAETLTDGGRTEAELDALFDEFRPAFVAVMLGMWEEGADAGRDDEIESHDFDIPASDDPDSRDDAIERQLRANGERAAEQVEHRIIGDLADALVEASDAGMSIPDIADVLRDEVFPDITGWQAERIARTEVISAHNKGALWAYGDADVPGKEWLATDDHRTRATHNAADGQQRPVAAPFEVGGASGQYPGDPSFPPSERIQCRCALAPVFDIS